MARRQRQMCIRDRDGVAGGWIVSRGVWKQDNGTRFELGSRQEVDNITCREIGDLFNSKGTKNKQPTLRECE